MVNSDSEPQTVMIDSIKNGNARLLIRWNITVVETADIMTKIPRKSWQYDERVMWWALPEPFATVEEVFDYISGIEEELQGWAQATALTSLQKEADQMRGVTPIIHDIAAKNKYLMTLQEIDK